MRFLRNIAVLGLGSMGAQFNPLLLSPIILRLYDPEAFGAFGVAVTVSTFSGVIATLKMEHAVIQARTEAEAERMYWAVHRMAIVLSVVLAAISSLATYALFPGTLSLWNILLILPQAVCMALIRIKQYYMLKIQNYGLQARTRIMQSGLTAGITILAGFLLANAVVLQLAALLAIIATLMVLPAPRRRPFTFATLRFALRKHRKFLYFSLPGETMNTMTVLAPQFLFAQVFGLAAGGQMAQTNRILLTPSKLIGGAIMEVFYRTALTDKSEAGNQALLFRYLSTAALNATIGIPLFTILYVYAEELIPFVFGKEWVELGVYVRVLAPAICVMFVFGPLTNLHYVLGTQVVDMLANMIFLLGIFLSVWWAQTPIEALTYMSYVIIVSIIGNNVVILFSVLKLNMASRKECA